MTGRIDGYCFACSGSGYGKFEDKNASKSQKVFFISTRSGMVKVSRKIKLIKSGKRHVLLVEKQMPLLKINFNFKSTAKCTTKATGTVIRELSGTGAF